MNNKIDKILDRRGTSRICPAIAILKGKKILIGLRNYNINEKVVSVWTIPAGRCEENEKIKTALYREVAEEVNISEFNITCFLGEVEGADKDVIVYLFVGTTNKKYELSEPEKFSKWEYVDVNKIPDNFINKKALKMIKDFVNNESI